MKYTKLVLLYLMLFSVLFCNCRDIESTKTTIEKNKQRDWETELQKATNFKEEIQLLKTLLQQDSSNTHQQLIANRLQTFDLRHLKTPEKLAILNLYDLSLQPTRQPSITILQIAYAKLNAAHPTNNLVADEKIKELLTLIKATAGAELEL